MPSARVRGTVLAGIAGLALSAMFGFAPAASADTGSGPAPLGLLDNTVGSTLGIVSSTVGGLTGALAPTADGPSAVGFLPAPAGASHTGLHRAHHKRHAKKDAKRRHHSRSGHARSLHSARSAHRPAGREHRHLVAARHMAMRPSATTRRTQLRAFDSSPAPQQNPGLLGGLLGGLTSVVNGTLSGVTGVVGGVTQVVGGVLGGRQSASGPPSSHRPPPPTHPGGGSPTPSGPGAPTPPPTQRPPGAPSATASTTPSTHHTRERALPAPKDVPSLIPSPSRTVVPTTRPQPTPTPSSSSPIAQPGAPVSLTSAPSGWVLFAAVVLFAIAVVFMVLGAGYRGRRTR